VESVWMPEAWGRDAFLALAAIAQVTDRVKLGTGIVNVYSRSPATLAMSTATLDELSNGRAVLGLGSSGPGVVERWHGINYERPLDRVREATEIIRLALSGATTNFHGSFFHVSDFKLAMKSPKHTIPIYVAALSSKMLQLAGEIGDGVLLYIRPLQTIHNALKEVAKGADKGGKSLDNFDIAAFLPTAISENRAEAASTVARVIAYYVGGMGTYYRRLISQTGFASEADMIDEAWQRGDKQAATDAVTERLMDSVALVGSTDECRGKLEKFRNQGVTLPILSLTNLSGHAATDFCQTIKRMMMD